jgi:hypothetical protein
MRLTRAPKGRAVADRRAGYVVAVLLNAAGLYVANVWPGWEALPFLNGDMRLVMPWVNASILVTLAANVVYLVRDPRWLKASGDVLTMAVGLLALVQVWRVFPFDFSQSAFDWALVTRVVLVVSIVGSIIGMVVAPMSRGKPGN